MYTKTIFKLVLKLKLSNYYMFQLYVQFMIQSLFGKLFQSFEISDISTLFLTEKISEIRPLYMNPIVAWPEPVQGFAGLI